MKAGMPAVEEGDADFRIESYEIFVFQIFCSK